MLTRFLASLVLVLALASPAWAATYFDDDFTDTNDTTLASHAPSPVGTSWTVIETTGASGTMEIESNGAKATSTSASSGHLYSADGTYATANYAIEVQLARWDAAGASALHIGCRFVAGLDGYVLALFGAPTTNDIRLYRADDSVSTLLGEADITPALNDIITLECNGTSFTVKRNGETVLGPITDSTYSAAGKAIVGAGDMLDLGAVIGGTSGNHRFEYFTVTSIDPSRKAFGQVVIQ